MSFELHFNTAQPVHVEPIDTVATSATVTLYKADSTATGVALVAAVPTAATTTASGTTALALTVASSAGFSVGELVRVTSQGVLMSPRVVRIDGSVLHLAHTLEHVPDNGSAVEAVRITTTIPALGVSLIGTDYRLEWTYTDAGGVGGYAQQVVDVVRWPWQSPLSADDVGEILAEDFDERRSDEFLTRIAARVSDKIRGKLAHTGRRAHLFPDPSKFREVALVAARLVLAEKGYIAAGNAAPSEWIRQLRYRFDDECNEVLQSLAAFDSDADGKITTSETKGHFRTFSTTR